MLLTIQITSYTINSPARYIHGYRQEKKIVTFDQQMTRRQVLRYMSQGALIGGVGSLIACSSPQEAPTPTASYELIVYGGTPSGITAALAAVNAGMSVAIIEPTNHLGGMLASGLGAANAMNVNYIGGLAAKFFLDIGKHYGNASKPGYSFEPHVAENIFDGYISSAGVEVYLNRHLASIYKSGSRINSITLDNGTGLAATQWIDASYEGDLMAAARASYTVGRESKATYRESLAGWGIAQSLAEVSPFLTNGQLIPGVNPSPQESYGAGDGKIMAYTFFTCLTTNKANLAPFPKPPGYTPDRYEGLTRFIARYGITNLAEIVTMQGNVNHKSILLTAGYSEPGFTYSNPFSTDYVGGGWQYPDASWVDRQTIWQDHYNYVAGWLYFVATDPSVPSSIQSEMNRYGLPLDEFTDHGNWPWQMYVREGRRLIGQYVLTQADISTDPMKADSVGMGNWDIDVHHCDSFVATSSPNGASANGVGFDGCILFRVVNYQIPYRILLPNHAEVSNLAVTCCLSASHISFASLRVEPVFMVLGEAAGTAAALAMKSGTDFSGINVPQLQSTLIANGGVLTP